GKDDLSMKDRSGTWHIDYSKDGYATGWEVVVHMAIQLQLNRLCCNKSEGGVDNIYITVTGNSLSGETFSSRFPEQSTGAGKYIQMSYGSGLNDNDGGVSQCITSRDLQEINLTIGQPCDILVVVMSEYGGSNNYIGSFNMHASKDSSGQVSTSFTPSNNTSITTQDVNNHVIQFQFGGSSTNYVGDFQLK
ncbi:hypothetical protein, partial [Spirosoma flavum]